MTYETAEFIVSEMLEVFDHYLLGKLGVGDKEIRRGEVEEADKWCFVFVFSAKGEESSLFDKWKVRFKDFWTLGEICEIFLR